MIHRNVAEYVANVRYKTDLKSLNRAKKFIGALENKFTRTVNNSVQRGLIVDPRGLSRKINSALASRPIKIKIDGRNLVVNSGSIRKTINDAIGKSVGSERVIWISNFKVNQAALNRTLSEALNSRMSYKVGIKPVFNDKDSNRSRQGVRETRRQNNTSYWNRQLTQRTPTTSLLMTGTVLTGGFGLNELNKQVQDWTMLQTKLTSVLGDQAKAVEKIENLKSLGQRVGANPLELANSYTQMLASTTGTALEPYFDSGFEQFTRYGKVMGLDEEAMKGSMRAVTQMISKDQIMAEELRGQLAERLPAAVRLMADAVAGGDTRLLGKMMEAGELKPSEVLPKFFSLMGERANQGWDLFTQSSRYQQGKAASGTGMLTETFTRNGGESGLFIFWKSMQEAINASRPFAILLGESFYNLSKRTEQISNTIIMFNEMLAKDGRIFSDTWWRIIKVGAILYTRFAKILAVASFLVDIIEDLTSAMKGGESVIKDLFKSVSELNFSKFSENLQALFANVDIVVLGLVALFLKGGWVMKKVVSLLQVLLAKLAAMTVGGTVIDAGGDIGGGEKRRGKKRKGKNGKTPKAPPPPTKKPVSVKGGTLKNMGSIALSTVALAAWAAKTPVGRVLSMYAAGGALVYSSPEEMRVAYGGDPWANAYYNDRQRRESEELKKLQSENSARNSEQFNNFMSQNTGLRDFLNGIMYSSGENDNQNLVGMMRNIAYGKSTMTSPSIENVSITVNGVGKDNREIGVEIANALQTQWSMISQLSPVN